MIFPASGIAIIAHDTQLAGIISSRGGAAYPNDIGVAPGADIYCARVANSGGGISSTWIINALNALINNHNCRVIVTGFELTDTILRLTATTSGRCCMIITRISMA